MINLKAWSILFSRRRALWFGEFAGAHHRSPTARGNWLSVLRLRSAISSARRERQGEAALGLNDLATADERLHHALTRARKVNLVEEELPALVALAELRRRQGDVKAARELLDDVWEAAERGPYPLFHADAYNVLAQIERDEGNQAKATEAAMKAYQVGVVRWAAVRVPLGVGEGEGAFEGVGGGGAGDCCRLMRRSIEPMPEVEIDPEDEFHVGKGVEG